MFALNRSSKRFESWRSGCLDRLAGHTAAMTSQASPTPIERAAELYAEYVDFAEISTLAELAATVREPEPEPVWTGAPPAGLVFSA